jgi:hypothetical protein
MRSVSTSTSARAVRDSGVDSHDGAGIHDGAGYDGAGYDGNVLAGPLREVFAVDVTSAVHRCPDCGRRVAMATLRVYLDAPGLVARCPGCDAVTLRFVRAPDRRAWLDVRGSVELAMPEPEAALPQSGADDPDVERVAAILREAAETHHRVYRIVDGDDPDWASWYAEWLIGLSELPDVLGGPPIRSELVYLLVRLGKEHTAAGSTEPWEVHYARGIVAALQTS